MHRAADILASLYPPSNDRSADRRALVFAYWENAAGETLARVAKPLEMRGRTLWVGVEAGPWLAELDAVEERIREKINGSVGARAVTAIRFRAVDGRDTDCQAEHGEPDGVADPIRRRLYELSRRCVGRREEAESS